MTEHTRFGPAGVPPMFRLLGATMTDVPKLLHEEGLDAFEYQASRWGPKPQMKIEDAQKLGEEAKKTTLNSACTAHTSSIYRVKRRLWKLANDA